MERNAFVLAIFALIVDPISHPKSKRISPGYLSNTSAPRLALSAAPLQFCRAVGDDSNQHICGCGIGDSNI